ncbi:hypothetical protein SAMN04487948_103229 [Halogranum amylolyticum]|uniref:Uncharacterized protein n=1 Tax=Halogranum amylolyticum TaxID=660520 RepID=A0A1H8QPN4_9EURY|nr:hypothetical protein SAMN04487948_103229 [Halogranum amylolyticum]
MRPSSDGSVAQRCSRRPVDIREFEVDEAGVQQLLVIGDESRQVGVEPTANVLDSPSVA